MAKRTNVQVVPDKRNGTWNVKVNSKVAAATRTKAEAVDLGRQAAKGSGNASLKIHKADGTIQEERTYGGKDPYPPKG